MERDQKRWEHYVTDVSEKFDYANPLLEPEERFEIDKTKGIPTVLIFGWSGAIDKYLKVYAKLYEERGLRTIRYMVPFYYTLFGSDRMLKIGEEMVADLAKHRFRDSPFIIHALSNGGAYQYNIFVRALEKTPYYSQVKGMIFDSSPTKRRILSLYRAIEGNQRSEYFKIPKSLFLTVCALQYRVLEMFIARVLKKECIQMNPFENLMNEKCRWPQHFIYSTEDKVVAYQYVEKFANHRRSLGVDVTMKRYTKSPHVQHYVNNKTSYVRSVVKFVNRCLKR